MAEYKAPGVYVEEVPSSVRPIAGVGTSTAGFIGRATMIDMPETPSSTDATKDYYVLAQGNDPKRITSWEDYKRNFGDFQVGNEILSHAVFGFFNNGGTACWISRAISANELEYEAAKITGVTESEVTQSAAAEVETLGNAVIAAETDEAARDAYALVLSKYTETETSADKVMSDANAAITSGTILTAITLSTVDYPEPVAVAVDADQEACETETEKAINRANALYTEAALQYIAQIKVNALAEAPDFEDALGTFEKIDEIAIVAAPGVVDNNTKGLLLTHCENLQDRFAVIDGNPLTADNDEIAKKTDPVWIAGQITGTYPGKDADALGKSANGYGSVYYPWIQVSNPLSQSSSDAVISVPPSGHMAGIFARSDSNRGVHKTPANELVRGALGVDYKLCKADHAVLNEGRINAIRSFNGSITLYGGRTYSDNSSFNYVSTRRLMNAVRESVEEGTQWTIFEPNDQALWKKIRRNITAYLTNVWRDEALFGETPGEAFYVKCDEDTNPEESRALGKVVTEIGIATVKPAEFVVFRISHS